MKAFPSFARRIRFARQGGGLVLASLLIVASGWMAMAAPATNSAPAEIKTAMQLREQWGRLPAAELQKLAESGNAEAAYVYGWLEMEQGRETVNTAFQHAKAAEPNGPVFKREEVFARWENVSRDELMKAVAGQNREAQYYWGKVGQGEGVVRTRQGFDWVRKAAEQGIVPAQHAVGMFYARRMKYVVVEADYREAERWFRLAAERGYEESCHQLAELSWEGVLGRPNLSETVTRLQQCVDLGCHRAEYQLAMLYATGVGEPRHDGERPAALLEKARAGGVPLAVLELAQRYRIGFGVPRHPVRAARYYVLLAQLDHLYREMRSQVEAIFELLTPDGNPKPGADLETSRFAEYLSVQTRAIQQLDPAAILQMVELETASSDDRRTRVFAYFWLSRAHRSGGTSALALRDRLAHTMSEDELKEARHAVEQDQQEATRRGR